MITSLKNIVYYEKGFLFHNCVYSLNYKKLLTDKINL